MTETEKWKARARELTRSIQGASEMVCDDPDCALCAIAVEQTTAALSAAYAEGREIERKTFRDAMGLYSNNQTLGDPHD